MWRTAQDLPVRYGHRLRMGTAEPTRDMVLVCLSCEADLLRIAAAAQLGREQEIDALTAAAEAHEDMTLGELADLGWFHSEAA